MEYAKKNFFLWPPTFHSVTLAKPGDLLVMGWHHLPSPLPATGSDGLSFLWTLYAQLVLLPAATARICDSTSPLHVRRYIHVEFIKMIVHYFLSHPHRLLRHSPVLGIWTKSWTLLHTIQYCFLRFHDRIGGLHTTNSW